MPYRFHTGEFLDDAVRRVVREELDSAIGPLSAIQGDRHKHVHEARKSIKKIRAILRLVRPALQNNAIEENLWYRDTARMLSGIRDAQAVIESLDKLRVHSPRRRPRQFARILKCLLTRRAEIAHAEGDLEASAALARQRLTIAGARIETWPVFPEEFATIGGLVTIYRRGRRLGREASRAPTATAIHEWRKRVKDHWYHIRLFEELWPDVMRGLVQSLGQLSEALGDHHDLETLRGIFVEEESRFTPGDIVALAPLIERRQMRLAEDARTLGSLIYGERPGQFEQRFARYWKSWRDS